MRAGKANRTPARGMAVPQPNKGAASFSSPKRAISRSPLRSLGSVSRLFGDRHSALVAEKADRFGSQSDPGIGDAADGSATPDAEGFGFALGGKDRGNSACSTGVGSQPKRLTVLRMARLLTPMGRAIAQCTYPGLLSRWF